MSLAHSERPTIYTPPGGSTTDDRDAWGFVDQSIGAGGTPLKGHEIWGTLKEMNMVERARAGLESAEAAGTVTCYDDKTITEGKLLRRQRDDKYWEIVAVERQYMRSFIRVHVMRTKT